MTDRYFLYSADKFSRSCCRLLRIYQPVGHGNIRLQRNGDQIGMDIFVNRLCDQDISIHFTQGKGINAIVFGIDDPGRRIVPQDLSDLLIR